MGTHALTTFSGDGHAFSYFRHYDGYPRVHGADLYNFLLQHPTNKFSEIGRKFEEYVQNPDGPNATVKAVHKSINDREEWTWHVRVIDDKYHITVYRYSDYMCKGDMKMLRELVVEHGGIVKEAVAKKSSSVEEDRGEWSAPDPVVCEAVELYQRGEWFKELCKGLSTDPTVSFIGSGDRVMIAMVDEVKDGVVWATIEDCLVTRRRHVKLNCDMPVELKPENAVTKTKLASALADVTNHFSKLDPQGMSYNDIAGWKEEMGTWLSEIADLTLAEPKK